MNNQEQQFEIEKASPALQRSITRAPPPARALLRRANNSSLGAWISIESRVSRCYWPADPRSRPNFFPALHCNYQNWKVV